MFIEKKILSGGIQSDVNLRNVPQECIINATNCRRSVSEFGREERYENCAGTEQLINNRLPPYGTSQTIGSTTYIHTDGSNRVVFANYNSSGDHGIYVYDVTNNVFYAVIYDSQVTQGLNFSKSFRINRNMKVIGGILYFCDGENNDPRAISIEAGIKANQSSYVTDVTPYSFPLDFSQITLIRRPPAYTPNIQKATDAGYSNNFIANESFEFAFEYGYYTNEKSVVGSYSPATRLNSQTQTYNYVSVTMDVKEQIPSTVKIVRLVVRRGDGTSGGGNIAYTVRIWDKDLTADRNEIIQHNNGTTLLNFLFYNDLTGEPIAPGNVLKPYDVVPNNALTLEAAKNRLFLANTIEGYDTPLSTSLAVTASVLTIGASTYPASVGYGEFLWTNGFLDFWSHAGYFVWLPASVASQAGYYEMPSPYQALVNSSTPPTLPSVPASIALSSLIYRGTSQSEVENTIKVGSSLSGYFTISYSFSWAGVSTTQITGATIQTYELFKSGSTYNCSVVFYDFAMRKCGVVKDGTQFTIAERNFSFSTGAINQATWTLSNTNAATEIPDWAYYYSVVRTLNLKTRFFVNGFSNAARYATKDAQGQYLYTNTTFPFSCVGVALNAQSLFSSGLGYTFTEGDQAVISTNASATNFHLPVIGQDGDYIIVKAKDIGDLSNMLMVFEIYTPYQTSEEEPFYEVGEIYSITNPTASNRTYGTLSDVFVPDTYAISRSYLTNTYFGEAMCPNDLFYQRWDNDGGKPNFITNLGRTEKIDYGRFSNTYIPNTLTNGLSTFDALNQFNVGEQSGAIQQLLITNKVQDKGTVMLAICESETNSIYLGETQISDGTGQTKFFAQSQGIVGTINDLKGSLGTRNPESIISYLGLVFGYDIDNGVFWQYSVNGLEVVSRYGVQRWFKNYSKDYQDANANNLNNINGYNYLSTAIDPFHKEVLFNACGLIYPNYADTLPSYTSVPSFTPDIINRFDIYDQLQKSLSFSFEKNQWGTTFNYTGEWYDYVDNKMFSWKQGQMYLHEANGNNWNQFHGTFYPMRLFVVGNFNQSLLKVLNGISVEGLVAPTWTIALTAVPNQQITDLVLGDFTDQEGNQYAVFFFDRLSPNSTGTTADQKLYASGGDPLTDIAIQVMVEFNGNASDRLIWINALNLAWNPAYGQKQIAQPNNG